MTDPSILRRAEQLGHTSRHSGGLRDSNPYVEHQWASGPIPIVQLMAICLGFDDSRLATEMRNTPSRKVASTFIGSASSGRLMTRRNGPLKRSWAQTMSFWPGFETSLLRSPAITSSPLSTVICSAFGSTPGAKASTSTESGEEPTFTAGNPPRSNGRMLVGPAAWKTCSEGAVGGERRRADSRQDSPNRRAR